MILSPVRALDLTGWHRLIPSRFSQTLDILTELADSLSDLQNLQLLDAATNDRIQGERSGIIGIATYELVYGIPNAHIVNAAFTHANEFGSRFNDNTRGAWYAAINFEAALTEVAFHKGRRLADIVVPKERFSKPSRDTSTFDNWLADFKSDFHLLEPADEFDSCLQPDPVPQCYQLSQLLARRLLSNRSNGLVYPSVRHPGADCIACFRPALVYSPRRAEKIELTLVANQNAYDSTFRVVPSEEEKAFVAG